MLNTRPIIGITLDAEGPGGYSNVPWYALRKNYCDCIAEAGGVPIALPHDVASAGEMLDLCDGIVVTGGGFDVPAEMFGQVSRIGISRHKPGRTEFETAVMQGAMNRDMPVLGICGGQQLLGVLLGGHLVQHIPDEIAGALDHNPGQSIHDLDAKKQTHPAQIVPGTRLAEIVGTGSIDVNTSHHQAVQDKTTARLLVNARAPDGVVEGIESLEHSFCLGVQWHPEYQMTPQDTAIIRAFVSACRDEKRQTAAPDRTRAMHGPAT